MNLFQSNNFPSAISHSDKSVNIMTNQESQDYKFILYFNSLVSKSCTFRNFTENFEV